MRPDRPASSDAATGSHDHLLHLRVLGMPPQELAPLADRVLAAAGIPVGESEREARIGLIGIESERALERDDRVGRRADLPQEVAERTLAPRLGDRNRKGPRK